ncbi:MAG: PhnD/SsuA/transferrin family substrate-binding protein, partial [Planctomycetota bacterium]
MNCISNVFAALTLFGAACFQSPPTPQTPPKPAPAPAPAPAPQVPDEDQRLRSSKEPLRISCVPGVEKEKFTQQAELVSKWLSKDLQRPVEIVPVDDFAAAVNGFATNKIDLAWLDGAAGVQAEQRVTDNLGRPHCQPLFAREQDVRVTSYFLANKKLIDAGTFKIVEERKPMPMDAPEALGALAALKPKFSALTFSFGPKTSTTGH